MTGIPTSILKELRQVLRQCDEFFASNAVLRDLFSDERIHPFGTGLPERDSVNGRIEATIAHLANKHRIDGRNALGLFLHVVCDQLNEADQRQAVLHRLASQLPSSRLSPSPDPAPPMWNTATIRQLLIEALSDQQISELAFDHFRPVYQQFSTGMTKPHMIRLLLEYCDMHNQIKELIDHIQRLNPAKYSQYQSHLARDT